MLVIMGIAHLRHVGIDCLLEGIFLAYWKARAVLILDTKNSNVGFIRIIV
jgi:hypothetical protein